MSDGQKRKKTAKQSIVDLLENVHPSHMLATVLKTHPPHESQLSKSQFLVLLESTHRLSMYRGA
jgi:hypothetical protein